RNNPEAAFYEQAAQEGARAFGRRLLVLKAGTPQEIDSSFAIIAEQRADAVIVSADPFYPGVHANSPCWPRGMSFQCSRRGVCVMACLRSAAFASLSWPAV